MIRNAAILIPRVVGNSIIVLMLATVMLICSCTFSAQLVSGRVLDGVTGEPIAGAYVVAAWSGYSPLHYIPDSSEPNTCYRISIARTGTNGRFSFPREIKYFGNYVADNVSVTAYAPNRIYDPKQFDDPIYATFSISLYNRWKQSKPYYLVLDDEQSFSQYFEKPQQYFKDNLDVARFRNRFNRDGQVKNESRIAYLRGISTGGYVSCGWHTMDDVRANRLPFERAIYEEAKMLAASKKDWHRVAEICDKAGKRAGLGERGADASTIFNRHADPMCPINHPSWTGTASEHSEVFEQIEKDFGIELEGMPH